MPSRNLGIVAGSLRTNPVAPWALMLVDNDTDVKRVMPKVREWLAGRSGIGIAESKFRSAEIFVQLADSSDDFARWEALEEEYSSSFVLTRGFKSVRSLHGYLSSVPRPVAIADFTSAEVVFKRRLAKNAPFYVRDGGIYLVDEPEPNKADDGSGCTGEIGGTLALLQAYGSRFPGSDEHSHRDSIALGAAFCGLESRRDALGEETSLLRQGDYQRKLRDRDATELLNARYGAAWGKELSKRPGHEFRVTSKVTTNRNAQRFPQRFKVPEISVRAYESATCCEGQVAVLEEFILPDSFRRPYQNRLQNRNLKESSPDFVEAVSIAGAQRVPGKYFYIDTEYPDHFGHVTTEVFARLAHFVSLRRELPELGVVISTKKATGLPGWLSEILDILEVPSGRRAIVRAGQPLRFDVLYAATPLMSQPQWIDPGMSEFWQELKERVVGPGVELQRPVFSTRAPRGERTCLNTSVVEELFESRGYEILLPETLPFAEQVRRFASAPAVAGFGGSNLFQMMFAPAGPRCVVAGDSYTAINEYMIAAVGGNPIHYSFHNSEIVHPENGWSWAAFLSNFTFDIDNDPMLNAAI